MNERDFSIGDRKFKLSKVDTFKQFHIVRKLGPILGQIIPVAQKLSKLKVDGMNQEEAFSAIVDTDGISKIMEGFAKLSDQDANFILMGLCGAVEISQPQFGSWARLVSNDQLMFQDLELNVLLQCAGRAFVFNMAGFFATAPQASPGGA